MQEVNSSQLRAIFFRGCPIRSVSSRRIYLDLRSWYLRAKKNRRRYLQEQEEIYLAWCSMLCDGGSSSSSSSSSSSPPAPRQRQCTHRKPMPIRIARHTHLFMSMIS